MLVTVLIFLSLFQFVSEGMLVQGRCDHNSISYTIRIVRELVDHLSKDLPVNP
jgi:hypothetical protein